MSFNSILPGLHERLEANDCIKVLKISNAEERELVLILEGEEQTTDCRRHRRYLYIMGAGLPMRVYQPGGSISEFIVVPRNISAGGLAFLHGGYLHAGTLCMVKLKGLDGCEAISTGHVVRCRYLCGRVYDIGLLFENDIQVGDFVKISGADVVPPEQAAEVQEQTPKNQVNH